MGKPKMDLTEPQKSNEANGMNETQEIYMSPERHQQIIDDLRLIWVCVKMEYKKIINLLYTKPDVMPRFNTKWNEFMINLVEHTIQAEK